MTDLSTLTDTELNTRLMEAMGWHWTPGYIDDDQDYEGWWTKPNGDVESIDFNCRSLDALKSGPEKLLREAGWVLAVTGFDDDSWSAEWWKVGRDFVLVSAPTERRARAEAVCQGLEVSK